MWNHTYLTTWYSQCNDLNTILFTNHFLTSSSSSSDSFLVYVVVWLLVLKKRSVRVSLPESERHDTHTSSKHYPLSIIYTPLSLSLASLYVYHRIIIMIKVKGGFQKNVDVGAAAATWCFFLVEDEAHVGLCCGMRREYQKYRDRAP